MSKRPRPLPSSVTATGDKNSTPSPNNKRRRNCLQFEVYLGDIGVPAHTIVSFINDTMRKEGFTESIGNANVINDFRPIGKHCYCLHAASEDLAEKVTYMNRICFRHTILRLNRHRDIQKTSPSKYQCWNEYFVARYGKNDPIYDVEVFIRCSKPIEGKYLATFLAQKLAEHGLHDLSRTGEKEAIREWREIPPKAFVFRMASPQLANSICYLNKVSCFEKNTLFIERHNDWVPVNGPPKYTTYLDFLKARNRNHDSSRAEKKQQKKAPPPQQQHEIIEILDDEEEEEEDDRIEVWEENKSLKKEVALVDKIEKNKTILSMLKKKGADNETKVNDLEIELKNIQDSILARDEKLSILQKIVGQKNSALKDIEKAQGEIQGDVDEQVIKLKEKRQEIQHLVDKIAKLREHNTNVTASLIGEEKERMNLRNILRRLETQYEERKMNLMSVKRERELYDV